MGRFQTFPLLLIPALIYTLIAIASGDKTAAVMASKAFTVPLPALLPDAPWMVTWGHLITMLSIIVLFVEILKSTIPSGAQMLDNGLSVGVFIICFVLWLLVRPYGTSEFFFIVMMCLLDFLAGSVIMTRVSQRTVQYDRN